MRLIGYVDGIEVLFDFYPPNIFKAEIPKKLDGIYIIELQAIDDANNTSNYSNIFVRIDFRKLKVQILSPNFLIKLNGSEYGYKQIFNNIVSKPIENQFEYKKVISYTYRELVV